MIEIEKAVLGKELEAEELKRVDFKHGLEGVSIKEHTIQMLSSLLV